MPKRVLGNIDTALLQAMPQGPWRDFYTKLTGDEGDVWEKEFKRFLRREPCWTSSVQTQSAHVKIEELITLPTVTSDGRTGRQFITSLERANYRVGGYAKFLLQKKETKSKKGFVSTSGIQYHPVLIKAEHFFDKERYTLYIRKVAANLKLITPPAELAPLLREKISDEEIQQLGLSWFVTMHEPIQDAVNIPYVLGSYRDVDASALEASKESPSWGWGRGGGFVFLAPQD